MKLRVLKASALYQGQITPLGEVTWCITADLIRKDKTADRNTV